MATISIIITSIFFNQAATLLSNLRKRTPVNKFVKVTSHNVKWVTSKYSQNWAVFKFPKTTSVMMSLFSTYLDTKLT